MATLAERLSAQTRSESLTGVGRETVRTLVDYGRPLLSGVWRRIPGTSRHMAEPTVEGTSASTEALPFNYQLSVLQEALPTLENYMDIPTDPKEQALVAKTLSSALQAIFVDNLTPTFSALKGSMDYIDRPETKEDMKPRIWQHAKIALSRLTDTFQSFNVAVRTATTTTPSQLDVERRLFVAKNPHVRETILMARNGKREADLRPVDRQAFPAAQMRGILIAAAELARMAQEDTTLNSDLHHIAKWTGESVQQGLTTVNEMLGIKNPQDVKEPPTVIETPDQAA